MTEPESDEGAKRAWQRRWLGEDPIWADDINAPDEPLSEERRAKLLEWYQEKKTIGEMVSAKADELMAKSGVLTPGTRSAGSLPPAIPRANAMTEPDSPDEEWVSNLKRKARIAEIQDAIKWIGYSWSPLQIKSTSLMPIKHMAAREHFGKERFAEYWNARPLIRLKSLLTNMWEAR